MKIDDIKIGERHREDVGNLQPLMDSIEEIGLLHPPVVNENGELIAGYRRVKACKKLGWGEIDTREVSIDSIIRGEFDENEVRKDFMAKEKVAIAKEVLPKEKEKAEEREMAGASEKFTEGEKGEAKEKTAKKLGWSRPSLDKALEIDEATKENPEEYGDLEETMEDSIHSTYNELKRRQETLEREKKLEDTPELKNLILGDCLEKIKEIPDNSIDCLITDPPYGINFKSNHRIVESINKELESDDESIFLILDKLFGKLESKLKENAHIYIFTTWKVLYKLHPILEETFKLKNCIIWNKNNWSGGDLYNNYASKHELILFAEKGKRELNCESRPVNILKAPRPTTDPNRQNHPTEKPVQLIEKLISNSTVEGETVFDPFAGSGSTLVAAEKLDRNWIGIELEERWYNTARERIAKVRNDDGE